jgi:signal transduction histidine kinase
VTLTNSSFNLYATTIFLVDNNGGRLIQTASVNSSGAYVGVAEGDAVPLDADPSIIALTARQRQAVLVNDVSVSPIYLPYAALPRTQSELAIPMVLGNQLLGVFDLQSDVAHRFAPDDLRVLTALSEQIAIAVRNAQLFAEARNAQSMAEQANQVKSKFLASMSHELRTPLNSILNFSELVVAGVLGPVNEQQVDVLQDVIDSGSHLLGLINDILDLTKIEVGMMELLIEQINVNAILDGVLSTAKGLLKDNPEIELISQIEPDLPPMAADKRRIRQVLLNLISNAIKFTPKGSITITAQRQDAAIHFTVRDTGIGIDPEDQALVFESFRQAKGGLVEGSGTGLGLPISKRIVEEHRGQMWLESQVKVGSTFHVVLPLEFQGHKASAFEIRTQE